ncbi:unnamed protein product [Parnassius apollo]|uniref:(apollo) hypothetical protein n=1 Tax=Parnassius apollo TaxID=110799 RepID=A0A8S3Y7A0_PARAO|nr:unnamed protein product [Parnassius apollo]
MRTPVGFAFLSFIISMVFADCIRRAGECTGDCEEGTYFYATGCGYLTREPTCYEPNPQPDTTINICDYYDCYCNPPTVRNTQTGKCVNLKDCN